MYQRVQTLSQLESDVHDIVTQGATLLPSPVTDLWHNYTQIIPPQDVHRRRLNRAVISRLQSSLQPGFDIGSVLKEVQMVKWYLRLRGVHD